MSVKLWSSTGALVVIPISGAVPSNAVYNAGKAYDSSGALYVYPIAGAVPATAVYLAGIAHTQDGAVYVTTDTPAGTIYNQGLRLNATGAIYVDSTAVLATNLPIPLWGYANTSGALYVDGGFFAALSDAGAGAVDTTALLSGLTATFTRATVAWTKLSTGLWASVASGTARSVYTGADTAVGTYAGYFAEPAATQLVTPDASIRDMMDAAWTAGATMTVAKTGTGIDGVVNSCSRLTGGAVSATNTIFQTLTAAASSRTYSVWLKRVTGTGTINITQDGGSTYTDVTSSINSSTFTRVELNASVLNAAFGIQVVTNGDVILADFNQFEAGAAATSPMATAGAARNADVLVYTGAQDYGAAGSMYCEGTPFSIAASIRVSLAVDNNSGNEMVRFISPSGAPTALQLAVIDGAVSQALVSLTPPLAVGTTIKSAGSWMANMVNFAAGGTLGTEDTAATMPTTDRIHVGVNVAANQWTGGIKNVRIWKYVFARPELSRMTS